jgi:signal peptide peptidase SppA
MPYPNEHACRLRDPNDFRNGDNDWGRTERKHNGKAYDVISGRLKTTGKWEDQAYRYPKETWTATEARDHCKSHKGILFEPATGTNAACETCNAESCAAPTQAGSTEPLRQPRLLDIMSSAWAIVPSYLEEIQDIYAVHLKGEKINLRAVEAAIGKPLDNKPKPYQTTDGVAIIPIEGVISRKMNMLTAISGGVSTQLLERDISAALSDPEVASIILYIDSPGGEAVGIQNLARLVHAGLSKKPIVAYTDGMMASAAMWIGAAASRTYISGNDTQVGSIGVVARHMDVSRREEQLGLKTTEIVAGKYKRVASQYGPLTEEGRQSIQDVVDHFYVLFTNDVAAFRSHKGLSTDALDKWAEGRVFIGTAGIKAGLVDGVSTLGRLMALYGPKKNSPKTIRAMVAERKARLRAETEV